jgi:hypothetical protein
VALEPNNPEAHYTVATYYWDKAYRDFRLQDKEKMEYVLNGIEAVDKAISIRTTTWRPSPTRTSCSGSRPTSRTIPARQQALLREADALRDRATELRKQKAAGEGND